MRENKNGQFALNRITYKTMDEKGCDMSSYYIEGQSGGLINEYTESYPDDALTIFVNEYGTKLPAKRRDGTSYTIRINGAEDKK